MLREDGCFCSMTPGDAQPGSRRGRNSGWHRLKKANLPEWPLDDHAGAAAFTTVGNTKTPPRSPLESWSQAGGEKQPGNRDQLLPVSLALPTLCIQGSSHPQLQPCPVHGSSTLLSVTVRCSSSPPRVSSTHCRDLPSCSGDTQPVRIFPTS